MSRSKSTLMEQPPAAPISKRPRPPLEAALAAAHELGGESAVESAGLAADRASETVERLTGLGPDLRQRVAELRNALLARHRSQAALHYLSALSAGESPEPIAEAAPDVSAELLSRFTTACGPGAFLELLRRCEVRIAHLDRQAVEIDARLEGFKADYSGLDSFVAGTADGLKERDSLRLKADRLRAALQRVQAELRRLAPDALGDPASLRSGLREARQLARRGDEVLDAMTHALEGVDGDLVKLVLDGDRAGAEPGKVEEELTRRRGELATAIKLHKRDTAGMDSSQAENLAQRALGGAPAALAELASVVRSRPLAFGPGLEAAIVGAMAESLATAPDFAEFLT